MNRTEQVRDIVIRDYRTAEVFQKRGINYCCGGNLSLEEVCARQQVLVEDVQAELDAATRTVHLPASLQFDEWPFDFLVDYITHVHHAYLKQTLPSLQATIRGFVPAHLKKYPYLAQVEDVFNNLADELLEHTEKEEASIFPYLKQIFSTYKRREAYGHLFVRMLSKPLNQIVETEHGRIAALLAQLRRVTGNYQFAVNACTNHQVIYHKLKELDADLVQHKHLENNILFPRAIAMEQELLQL